MEDDEIREEDKQSLAKEMAKKGISKKIKTIPLGTKVLIISIFGGVVFLLLFVIIVSLLSVFFFFDSSDDEDYVTNFSYISSNAEDNYWWPIGGSEVETVNGDKYAIGNPTSTRITSYFSASRTINGVTKAHNGIDIGSTMFNTNYIIAVASGVVYQVGTGCDNNGYYQNSCGGGFGNYVIIEHPGSVYTIYAHLYPNSITVSKGEKVNQGQIIGEMGNSGSSTGTHLHFQLEVGGRSSTYAVDPLDYISVDNPRPITVNSGSGSNQMLSMLQSWEGTGPTNGNYYIVYDDGYGTLTVGHGVTLKNHGSRFSARQVDVSTLSKGSKVEKSIVDDIELEIINEYRTTVVNILNNNNISLEEHQIDALSMRIYNTGNISNFSENYKRYGNTQALYDNYMSKPVTSNGKYSVGLDRRRQAEWDLFHKGIYRFNS